MKINIHSYGKGFPLVFFHGWGFDCQIWLTLVPKLFEDYQLILVDLPGFGHSPVMDWESFKELLVEHLPDRFAIIGWSMGGLYAMRLAVEEPGRVDYLVNITSSPRFLNSDLWPGVSHDVFKKFYKNLLEEPHATLKEFLVLNGLSRNDNQFHLPDKLPSQEGLELGLKILETWDLREKLKQFDKPSCFIFGRLDPIVPIKTMNFMKLSYPDFHYVLFKRAAHMPFLSHMDLFIEELRGFIK
ncbi:alpha/beta fold hydrolase [Legionella parisiensis]|uniref:Pimeloyl-[acyl-carrier protein] methyl ester esterase n=1 Tax=Legionella parisiensis TaxID=45071 RepID=A0A1E5JVI1_9GAMM|nr:alpha/beta fold hydrolase [Legionella parisiensis]KTD41229.1 Biotin biosynthesis protein BioH [Legionella parisiensis]OEH48521.1 Pimeloyl-[acyl-carrier protein] methyl ester esterase [Legionella parisiensis]STX76472.1 Biotin biosynthesis protein BioH [Legionella parisiensis]